MGQVIDDKHRLTAKAQALQRSTTARLHVYGTNVYADTPAVPTDVIGVGALLGLPAITHVRVVMPADSLAVTVRLLHMRLDFAVRQLDRVAEFMVIDDNVTADSADVGCLFTPSLATFVNQVTPVLAKLQHVLTELRLVIGSSSTAVTNMVDNELRHARTE